MTVSGPGFVSLQVRDLELSAAFYEQHLGFVRQAGPPHAVVFGTAPAAFAVRSAAPGVDLDAAPLGRGIGLWLHASEAESVHAALVAAGVPIAVDPVQGPFGFTFTFEDPDGYLITLHDRA